MKTLTFKGANPYTCLAYMLEDFNMHKTDVEIMLDMRLPYLFTLERLSKTKTIYKAGSHLYGKPWFDIFLNHYQLEMVEETLSRQDAHQLLKNLSKFKRKAFLLITINHQSYPVVFDTYHFMQHTYQFYNPEIVSPYVNHAITIDESDLINFLTKQITIGYINPLEYKQSSLLNALSTSIKAIEDYSHFVENWFKVKRSKNRQVETYHFVFRTLLVDVRRQMKIKGEMDLHDELNILSHRYLYYLNTDEERFIIPLADEFKEAIKHYLAFVKRYYKRVEHRLTY